MGNNAEFANADIGSNILWFNDDFGFRREISTSLISKSRHKSFGNMLRAKGVSKCLPTVTTIAQGESVYRKFYSDDKVNAFGALCIGLKVAI